MLVSSGSEVPASELLRVCECLYILEVCLNWRPPVLHCRSTVLLLLLISSGQNSMEQNVGKIDGVFHCLLSYRQGSLVCLYV